MAMIDAAPKVQLPRRHPAQKFVLSQSRRFNVVVCGRRWGKSTLALDRLVEPALEGYPVGYFAPEYKTLTEVWEKAKRRLASVTTRKLEQSHRLEIMGGGLLEMWTLDDDGAGRSRRYKRVVVDEAGLVKNLAAKWQADIRPTLSDFEGDGWFFGTPKGLNFYHTLYQRGQDPEHDDWMSWQMETATNPYISPDEIESARRELPERIFAQEYLATFLEFEGAVFRRVMESATAGEQAEPVDGHTYVMGVDWGKLHDFTVLAVVDVDLRALVALERFNQIDYSVQRGRLKALWDRFNRPLVVAETNSMGEPVIEQLRSDGIWVDAFTTTNASKAAIIEGLTLALDRGEFEILNDPVLTGEMLAYIATRLPSGLVRYSAPEGMHDDTVMATALALHGAATTGPIVRWA